MTEQETRPASPEWEALADIIMAHQRIPMYDGSGPVYTDSGLPAQRCSGLGCDSLEGESDGPNSPRHAWHLTDLIIAAGYERRRDVAEADALRKQVRG